MSTALFHPSDPKLRAYQPRIRFPPSNHNALASSSTASSPPPPPPLSTPPQHSRTHSDDVPALTSHGIKVRDFAYENTLPPVTPVPRFSVQVQPRPRTLQRTYNMAECAGHEMDEESDEEDPNQPRTFYIDSNGTGTSHAYRYRKKGAALQRTLTEPADDLPPSQNFNTRPQVFDHPSHLPAFPQIQGALLPLLPTTPHRPTHRRSPKSTSLSPIFTEQQSQPAITGESQESEVWVDTPLVTPNGSLQWPVQNTSALPASQLEYMLPQLSGVEDDVTMSQLGFSPERSQQSHPFSQTPSQMPGPSWVQSQSQQLSLLTEPESRTPSPNVNSRDSPIPSRARRARGAVVHPTPSQQMPPPRYDLRQRPLQAARPTTTSRPTSRTRSSKHGPRTTTRETTPPPTKKRKITPPTGAATRARRVNGDINENM